MWGWATWKRSNELVKKSWDEFDMSKDFQKNSLIIKNLKLNTIWPQDRWILLWVNNFKNTFNNKIDTWDYQWVYTCLKNDRYCIRPNVNMVKNIGFNENATHTKNMKINDFETLNIKTDYFNEINLEIDDYYEKKFVAESWQHFKINYQLLTDKIRRKILKIINK